MTTCTDNARLGLIGCAQSYGGELQHSVVRVPWSRFPDGRAHVTASLSVIDLCWAKGPGKYEDDTKQMADPVAVGLHQDDRGLWRVPLRSERAAALAQIAKDRVRAARQNEPGTPPHGHAATDSR